ncbi:hypothetical protein [Amycolatopsis sp. GM8]|uniref:hypothetical protein n=1 Tax=Amycolatopsis sp. GM8 TaxID=2896530 RepID=UPI001F2BBB34|nr:hypothetical protein [Amycolatopsis sp. GM8]
MRTQVRRFTIHTLRLGTILLALLATGTGVANAADNQVAPATETMSFGVLGPVGLAAVALGIVGMALGVIRQRRKAAQAPAEPAAEVAEDGTRPTLTPYRRPTL